MKVSAALERIATVRGYLGMPVGEAVKALAGQVEEGRSYGQLDGLRAIRSEAHGGITLFADTSGVIFAYLGALDVDPAKLRKHLGKPDESLRSRAGKTFQHHVYGERGLAFSTRRGGDSLRIVEVFSPCSPDDYRATLYEDPGRFIE